MQVVRNVILVLVVGVVAYAAFDVATKPGATQTGSKDAQVAVSPKQPVQSAEEFYRVRREAIVNREPVPVNCGDDVCKAFSGGVHPLLGGKTELLVNAQWGRIGTGRDNLHKSVPDAVYSLFRDLKVAEPSRVYTERELSAFLPEEVQGVGQVWELDSKSVRNVLEQFHRKPSTTLVAPGRMAGPNGAYAILRAVTDKYLDVVFRVHAEFDLTPEIWLHSNIPMVGAWYTPAYLGGRMIVNREAGTVEYFRIALPTERTHNVHLTFEHDKGNNHDIVRVDPMELVGGNGKLPETIQWDESIEMAQADLDLRKVFYKFMEIEWLPVAETLAAAREQNKPIFAMVFWGAVDDQSC